MLIALKLTVFHLKWVKSLPTGKPTAAKIEIIMCVAGNKTQATCKSKLKEEKNKQTSKK